MGFWKSCHQAVQQFPVFAKNAKQKLYGSNFCNIKPVLEFR